MEDDATGKLPIARPADTVIARLAEEISAKTPEGADFTALEEEMNEYVFHLHGLTAEEQRIVRDHTDYLYR